MMVLTFRDSVTLVDGNYMMVLTFRDVSKFAGVNPATEALISDGFIIDLFSFMPKFKVLVYL